MRSACGKDGIAHEVNIHDMGKTKPADFAHAATNYAKLVQPPVWYTYTPSPNIDNAPQDSSTLDFLYENKTRHMHSTSVQYMSPVHPINAVLLGRELATARVVDESKGSSDPAGGGHGGGISELHQSSSRNAWRIYEPFRKCRQAGDCAFCGR